MQHIFSTTLPTSGETLCDEGIQNFHRGTSALAGSAKRAFDLAAVGTAFLLMLPLLVTIALIMLSTQGGPVFIRHKRVGRNGALFGCIKFRTMAVKGDAILQSHLALDAAARAEWEATRKLKDDPRVTELGKLMRRLSIDELPQLFNVLRGEMSLVGPRPIVQDEVRYYGNRIELYKRVRPGLTGSWQVSGRNDVSYTRRVELDSEYVANWSFKRDLSILIRTVPAVLTAKGCY